MSTLPLGSVVRLKKDEKKLMIVSRTPICSQKGTIGYFDYAACVYPIGLTGQKRIFFNKEDIEEVFFEGYIEQKRTE